MKFICAQSELNHQLSSVSRAIPSRPSRPILANVLATADADSQTITLVGFDEVLGIESRFDAQVEESGTLTLPAKLLGDIVSRLPDGDLSIAVEEDEMTLASSSGRYQVKGLSAEDYPALPTVEDGEVGKNFQPKHCWRGCGVLCLPAVPMRPNRCSPGYTC